ACRAGGEGPWRPRPSPRGGAAILAGASVPERKTSRALSHYCKLCAEGQETPTDARLGRTHTPAVSIPASQKTVRKGGTAETPVGPGASAMVPLQEYAGTPGSVAFRHYHLTSRVRIS